MCAFIKKAEGRKFLQSEITTAVVVVVVVVILALTHLGLHNQNNIFHTDLDINNH